VWLGIGCLWLVITVMVLATFLANHELLTLLFAVLAAINAAVWLVRWRRRSRQSTSSTPSRGA
jgi:hypothetical protein